MKRLTLATRIQIAVALLAVGWVASAVQSVSDRAPRGQADSNFWEAAAAHLAAREYWASETGEGLQAPNRVHDLRSYFHSKGVEVRARTTAASAVLVDLSLVGIGRGEALEPIPAGEVTHAEGRVEIARPELGLVEWFENSSQGLEQGFTLNERPGDGERGASTRDQALVLELGLKGARARLHGEAVVLTTEAGRRLSYGKLAVVDARGTSLAARFEVPDSGRIRMLVDDANAAYPIVVDPLLVSTADTLLESNQADAHLGQSVASAGDVNGDGYDDVIVGAPSFDAGNADEGAAFVFLGSATGVEDGDPATAHAQLESNQGVAFLGPLFGQSVGSAGDVNGDGYGDVIVGAPSYDGTGAAFIFRGSAAGIADGNPATAQTRLTTTETEAGLGTSVASAGDVNGDGYGDVIVGAPNFDAALFNEGAAFLFLGSATGIAHATTATAHARLGSDQGGFPSGSIMGSSVASAGDVNGDGYGDVIVGAPNYDGSGKAFVFLGSATGMANGTPATAHARFSGFQAGSFTGTSVASAGDVNGDGYSDVIVGASGYGNGQTQEGAAFVFVGSSSGMVDGNPGTAATVLEGNSANARLGVSVASAGDVNGDGFGDVAVAGAGNISTSPQVTVFLGRSAGIPNGGPTNANYRLLLNVAPSVASAGDVDGDGYDDLVVGAPLESDGQSGEGAAIVLHGGSRGIIAPIPNPALSPTFARAQLESDQASGSLAATVASAGDVNGDGIGDVIVGAPSYDAGQVDEGAAFVFLGSASGPTSGNPVNAHARFEANQVDARMGSSVASAGDVNGDGYGDVIIGARLYDSGETDEGGAFVFLGSASGMANGNPATAHARFQSNWALSELGTSVASAGDVNGDGYGDVIIGAPKLSAGEALEGVALVFLGSPTGLADGDPFTTLGWIESDQDLAQLGNSVASAGDVNGDGYGDVIVGSYVYSSGQGAEEGAAFVFHGSPAGIVFVDPSTAAARIESNQGIADLGWSVASAGDVNGDGYGDVVVGAPLYDAGETNEGAAFVFLGSASGIGNGSPATAHAQLESNQANAELGTSVASIGDLDSDGYADVIVGAPRYDDGQTDEGLALVFRGSASGIADGNPATARARFESNQDGALLGSSVAAAGDVNGDGFGDLILGAVGYDAGQLDEGAAFVYLGNPTTSSAAGRPTLVRQRRGDGSGIGVAPGSAAFAPDRFKVELRARSPRGRERAKLEVEACPSGTVFGDVSCTVQVTPSWVDLGASGALLSHTVTGLVPNKTYHWRARAHYAPFTATLAGITPSLRSGPWFRLQGGATPGGDVRTVPEPGVWAGLAAGCALLTRIRQRRDGIRVR